MSARKRSDTPYVILLIMFVKTGFRSVLYLSAFSLSPAEKKTKSNVEESSIAGSLQSTSFAVCLVSLSATAQKDK